MIDYSLAWLKSSGVEQVFVVVCNGPHSRQIIDYLAKFERLSLDPKFTVTTIAPMGSVSAGDALRFVYERDVIHGDFVLISGDTVTNMSLKQKLKHLTGNNDDQLVMAIHPNTKELLYYDEDGADSNTDMVSTLGNKGLLLDNPAAVQVHNDIEDCYIDVCSPEVLSLFADNFDHQHLRCHLVRGLLEDDIMGYRIFMQEIDGSSYAARVDNFRSYDTTSKDIIQWSTYPLKLESQGTIYKGSDIQISSSADVGPFTLVGSGTSIGDYSKISNSGSYIWDNVTIQDGCQLNNALVCDGVVIESEVVLEPGVVLSFKVIVVGPELPPIPAYSKVSLHPQPTNQDSDEEELEYTAEEFSIALLIFPMGRVGYYIWSDTTKPETEMLPGDGETSDDPDSEAEEDFDKEVEASFLRLVHEGVDQENTIIASTMKLAFETPYGTKGELLKNAVSVITTWRDLLRNYVKSTETDEQIEIITTFEEMCSDLPKILLQCLIKFCIGADAADKMFVNQSQSLIEWLKQAEEEEEEEDQIP
ncbi:hypothetical protein MKX01_013292 [Papaver californicum]|nr:hypothetical protein MKX01_013292 [Papaver californicum]